MLLSDLTNKRVFKIQGKVHQYVIPSHSIALQLYVIYTKHHGLICIYRHDSALNIVLEII